MPNALNYPPLTWGPLQLYRPLLLRLTSPSLSSRLFSRSEYIPSGEDSEWSCAFLLNAPPTRHREISRCTSYFRLAATRTLQSHLHQMKCKSQTIWGQCASRSAELLLNAWLCHLSASASLLKLSGTFLIGSVPKTISLLLLRTKSVVASFSWQIRSHIKLCSLFTIKVKFSKQSMGNHVGMYSKLDFGIIFLCVLFNDCSWWLPASSKFSLAGLTWFC